MQRKVRRSRREPGPPGFREAPDPHDLSHDGCLVAAVTSLIPQQWAGAWHKGLHWRPKSEGWAQSLALALQSVLAGKRPLLYGWREDLMRAIAAENGLGFAVVSVTAVAFPEANRDMAELLLWGHFQPKAVQHIVNGVLLGYPLAAVETWVRNGYPGPTLEEVLGGEASPG